MRVILMMSVIALIAVSAATLKPDFTDNAYAYANARSREFARGDNRKLHGWRECVEMESSNAESAIICEGTRTIEIRTGHFADVNYFCEFRFVRDGVNLFRVDHQLCQ